MQSFCQGGWLVQRDFGAQRQESSADASEFQPGSTRERDQNGLIKLCSLLYNYIGSDWRPKMRPPSVCLHKKKSREPTGLQIGDRVEGKHSFVRLVPAMQPVVSPQALGMLASSI